MGSLRLAAASIVSFTSLHAAEDGIVLEVSSGPYTRVDSPARWEVPAGVKLPEAIKLVRADDGREVPAQIDAGPPRAVVWILDGELPARRTRRYVLSAAAGPQAARVELKDSADGGKPRSLTVSAGGKDVLRYNAGEVAPPPGTEPIFARSGYIHPLWSPAGRIVTNDSPPNHKHHHGVWMPWSQTTFEGHPINFWEQASQEGKVECVAASGSPGPVFASFNSRHRFIDLKNKDGLKDVLNETWDVKVYAASGPFIIDFVSVQTCAGTSSLVLRQYRYGGFGFRGSVDWEGKDGCEFLTSEGRTRVNGHATAARWCDVRGKVKGELAGVAFLCHPANFRAPQDMRIHDTEPFFNFAPCQEADFTIEPGKPLVSRYRIVVHDGALDASVIDRMWHDYAEPPVVKLASAGS